MGRVSVFPEPFQPLRSFSRPLLQRPLLSLKSEEKSIIHKHKAYSLNLAGSYARPLGVSAKEVISSGKWRTQMLGTEGQNMFCNGIHLRY